MSVTAQQVTAAVKAVAAIAEAIRELGSIPSGHLYAQVMGSIDLPTYNRIIDTIKKAGLCTESGSVLTWTGPAKA